VRWPCSKEEDHTGPKHWAIAPKLIEFKKEEDEEDAGAEHETEP